MLKYNVTFISISRVNLVQQNWGNYGIVAMHLLITVAV
jgi:hypothetical protein